ncbi:MAG: sulfite exporter TauE/SafE family protein [Rhizonema sp. NSF051]|nr:sulfite exporter TauE/SafE family protein [Rhizonema sp. NSF051]
MTTLTLFSQPLLLFGASLLTGALNGVAGGGSFISFPALLFAGLTPINANATNNTVTLVGYLASIRAYRHELLIHRQQYWVLIGVSVIGGAIGSLLLLHTPQTLFTKLVPYLLLIATALFALNPLIATWFQIHRPISSKYSPLTMLVFGLLQFTIATYGGFFGGGSGILMLATFSIMGMKNVHAMNALKTTLNACINSVAMLAFMVAGAIAWQYAILMSCGSLLGGYWGVYYVRRIEPKLVRSFIILIGLSMTVYFFIKTD